MRTVSRSDRETLWRHLLVGVVVALLVMIAAVPAQAQAADGFEIDIPIVKGVSAPEGSITPLGPVVQVPEQNQGERCLVTAHSENQQSVHPGNDLIVESGSTQVVIPDVEAVPGGSVDGEGILTLGSTIAVSLLMGPDEGFSAGIVVSIDCTVFRFGQIIVVKEVEGGDDTGQLFDFTTSYDDIGFSLEAGEQNNSGDLRPGVYMVAENPPPEGWTLVGASCDDGSPVDGIDLQAYETVTCTFVNVADEVMASIVVDVGSSCDVVDGIAEGEINVSVSVDDGATVTVRDSDGDVVATATEDATIDAQVGATYTWAATPSEGFEFPPGSATSGTVTVEDCVEVLPFTGSDTELLLALSILLIGTGATVLRLTPRGKHT